MAIRSQQIEAVELKAAQARPRRFRSTVPTLALRFLLIALLAALGPAGWAACVGPAELETKLRAHPDAATYASLGNWFGDQHNLDCAVDAFTAALKLEPGSGKLNYMLGLSLYSGGHVQEAIAPLELAVRTSPDILKAHLLLATVYEQAKFPQEARTQWEAALKVDPASTIALDGLSKSLIAEGDYAGVVDHLKPNPENEEISLDLALAYGKMGKLEESANVLNEALKVHPSSFALVNGLVSVRVQQTRYQDAAALAEKVARLNPRNLDAQALYLRVLVLNGDTDIARPLAVKLLAVAPHNFEFLYLSGILERQAGDYAAAKAHLEEAISINPNYYNAHYNLGGALAKLGDAKGAREQFEKALELGATEPEVRFDLAAALRTLGETQLAQEQLKLYQQELKDRAARTLAAGKAAQADQAMASDPTKAAGLYREAFEATPENAMLGYKLAMALDAAGDLAGERTALEQVVKIDPTMALAQNQLGYLESRSGDIPAAERQFKLALQSAPQFTQAWVSLAATLGMESKFPEAKQALANALQLDPKNAQAQELAKALNAAQAQQ